MEAPLRWRSPRTIFVNSTSDLFHKGAPPDDIPQVFATIEQADWHTFQVLTQRAEWLEELAGDLPWPGNVWMGASVENADYPWRIEHLQRVPAPVRFLSVEPLLGPIPECR